MINRTTINLTITRGQLVIAHARAYFAQRDPLALLGTLILAMITSAALGTSLYRMASTPAVAAVPTPPLPIIIVATALAQPVPTAVPFQQVAAVELTAPRYVVAFASPDGAVLGPIPEPALSAITGRWGDTWISTVWQGATVWMRSADLGTNLANLAPAPQPQVVYVAAPAAPAAEQPYQADSAPPPAAATPAPAPALSERQQNIQSHYVEVPTLAPMEQTDVTKEWARVQWLSEHPEVSR